MKIKDHDHFKQFASWLEYEIAKYGVCEDQFSQLTRLLELEEEFRTTLIAHKWGAGVYKDFIHLITEERRNVLSARPFFRERQETFTAEISDGFKYRDASVISRFRVNYRFISFAMGTRNWKYTNKRMRQIFEEIKQLRTEIIEQNMPLVINRARLFFNKTPRSHLTLMDLIQISTEGIIAGVDKYTPLNGEISPRSWRGVVIGRITGDLISCYSETQVHFFPADKRKIYRANKFVGKSKDGLDFHKMAASVNDGLDGVPATNASEIAGLMAAASVVSADSVMSTDPDAPEPIARFAAPESCRPDNQYEKASVYFGVKHAIAKLSVFERKLLRLKGVDF